jgi:hypothetical protein
MKALLATVIAAIMSLFGAQHLSQTDLRQLGAGCGA